MSTKEGRAMTELTIKLSSEREPGCVRQIYPNYLKTFRITSDDEIGLDGEPRFAPGESEWSLESILRENVEWLDPETVCQLKAAEVGDVVEHGGGASVLFRMERIR